MLQKYQSALSIQLFHAGLCLIWNAVALWQRQHGIFPIGPTATYIGLLLIVVIASCLIFSLKLQLEKTYLFLSLITVAFTVLTIVNAFVQDPQLWPLDFWRYMGIAINVIGVIGFIIAMRVFVKGKFK